VIEEQANEVVVRYLNRVKRGVDSFIISEVLGLTEQLLKARSRGATVLLAGNGGSASTVNHYAIDWMLGSEIENPPLRVVSLSESVSSVTATGNDKAFEKVFSRQVERLGTAGDLLVLVSASGNSVNLIEAAETAKQLGVFVVAITGFSGGKLKGLADLSVHVSTQTGDYGVAEDLHLALGHMVKELLIREVRDARY